MNYFDWVFAYDPNGNTLLWSERNWSGNAWVNSTQYLYEYDGMNNLLTSTNQDWNVSVWTNIYKEVYTYDLSGNSLTGQWLKRYNGNWHPDNGILRVFSDHQVDSDIWLSDLYRYAAIGDSVMVFMGPDPLPALVKLYPNPAHSIVYVAANPVSDGLYGTLTLFDLQGQAVFTKPLVSATTAMDISGQKPGIYFVRFSDNRMTRIMKLVKE